MAELETQLVARVEAEHENFSQLTEDVVRLVEDAGYEIVEQSVGKPWGVYLRLNSNQAGKFIAEFFPGLTLEEARLGMDDAELSPKFLLVRPGERLSWQYHHRRAERWRFLTSGAYKKSETDDESELMQAAAGEVVQFQKGERHRLEGLADKVVLVAEIWQHTDASSPSNEEDIVRLADDYNR